MPCKYSKKHSDHQISQTKMWYHYETVRWSVVCYQCNNNLSQLYRYSKFTKISVQIPVSFLVNLSYKWNTGTLQKAGITAHITIQ